MSFTTICRLVGVTAAAIAIFQFGRDEWKKHQRRTRVRLRSKDDQANNDLDDAEFKAIMD